MKTRSVVALILLGLLSAAPSRLLAWQAPVHDHARWEKDIAAMEAADRDAPPAKGGIVFIGSSTIRLWKTLAQDYPGRNVINRGFGGTELIDSTYFADRLVFPHEPKQVIIRAGGNDISNGRLPREVAADFGEFVRLIHSKLPKAEILFIGWNPSIARWGQTDKLVEMNRLVREMALEMPHVAYIDAVSFVIGPDGLPRPELFVKDGLHFSPEGYKLLAEIVRPYLRK
jgi:lysophospholipase L1-like esterase